MNPAAREENEIACAGRIGIEPKDFRAFTLMFAGQPVITTKTLDPSKVRKVVYCEMAGKKFTFIKTSYNKNFKKGHALHERAIFEIRGEDWRILFKVDTSAAGNEFNISECVHANLPIGGWINCFALAVMGDKESMLKDAVLLRMFT